MKRVLLSLGCGLLSLLGLIPVTAGEEPAAPVWPYSRIIAPEPPVVDDENWSLNPIDAFVRARLEAAGLTPAPGLRKPALLRRLAFDLTGLPPTAEELSEFLADNSSTAYEKMVDRYLASQRYGERWARHWLDVVRYAETDGFAIDGDRPTLWRYRDYVIRTFNENRPFDQFIRQQIAGDELKTGIEGSIATGFYRLGQWEADNMIPEVKRQDYLNDITNAFGAAFLGLTLDCARCHDHKYDPIPARDFYRLQAYFAPLQHSEVPAEYIASERSESFDATKAKLDKEMKEKEARLASFRRKLQSQLAVNLKKHTEEVSDEEINKAVEQDQPFSKEDKARIRELTKAVATFKEGKQYASVAWTVKAEASTENPAETHVLGGGDVAVKGERVTAGTLSAIPSFTSKTNPGPARVALADWVTSPENPLTARVLVNRIWLHHFGEGIVSTPNNFGRNGSGATHPEILDHLAARLIEHGWRLKPLHREIVTSQSYRLSTSHPDHEGSSLRDPENKFLWRAHYRRLEAETLRDAILHVSGQLRHSGGGPGFLAKLPGEMGSAFPFFKWHPSSEKDRSRRSIFMFQRRNMVHPMMESFDVADASESCARRNRSLHPLQVFDLLNSEFAHECSQHFAKHVRATAGEQPSAQVRAVFSHGLSRPPTRNELAMGIEFLERDGGKGNKVDKLTDLCLVIFNTNEFLYLK